MNPAHAHLMLNHFPVVGLLFLLPLLIYSLVRDHQEYYRLASLGMVLLAVVTVPVYLSGEGAEEMIERLPDFTPATHSILERHEDIALFALIGMLLLGGLALLLLLIQKPRPALFAKLRWLPALAAAPTLVALVTTANLGGQIMHPEIRDPAATLQTLEGYENHAEDRHGRRLDHD